MEGKKVYTSPRHLPLSRSSQQIARNISLRSPLLHHSRSAKTSSTKSQLCVAALSTEEPQILKVTVSSLTHHIYHNKVHSALVNDACIYDPIQGC